MEFLTRSSFLYTCFSFRFEILRLSYSLYFPRLSPLCLLSFATFFVSLPLSSVFAAPLSFSLSISRVSPIFHPFLFILLMLLSHPLTSHSVLFLFLSIFPSPLCLYLSSDRSSGTAIPPAIYRACCGEPWGFEIVYGAYGGIRSTVLLRACATKHHLNAGTVSRCRNFSRAFNSELIRVMKHTRCFKLTR